MTTQEAFFEEHNPLMWSGEESTIEEFSYSDGFLALVLGGMVVGAAATAALLITVAYWLGEVMR